MNKKIILISISILFQFGWGQTNSFPPSGKAGIGTTNPSGNLEIADPNGATLTISTDQKNGSRAEPLTPSIEFLGFKNGSKAKISATEHTYNTYGSKLSFFVNNGDSASNLTERLTIIKNGNVGIGTTDPTNNLEIADSNGATLTISTNQKNGSSAEPLTPSIEFLGFKNGSKAKISASEQTYDTNGSKLSFFVNNGENASNLTERMTIIKNGNVGIGTTDPTNNLEIADSNGATLTISTNQKNGSRAEPLTPSIEFLGFKNGNKAKISATEQTYDTNGSKLSFFVNNGENASNLTERMTIIKNGNVGIGTTDPSKIDSKLTVAGKIHSQEVQVTINAGADFVFDDNYNLPSLKKLESFIKKNNHLPEILSEEEMKQNGLKLAEMNIKLLQKIEELTLYTIQQQKEIDELKSLIKKIEYP